MIVFYGSEPHYRAHLEPIAREMGMHVTSRKPHDGLIVTASFKDTQMCWKLPVVLVDHGAGQSYPGDPKAARSGSYAGGDEMDNVVAFLCPNEAVADRWAARYPDARVEVTGSAYVESLKHQVNMKPNIKRRPDSVAIAFHWDSRACTESRWAFPHYQAILPTLAERYDVIGHAHPRAFHRILPFYQAAGIEPVEDLREVVQRAQLLVCDNSSIQYMWATLERPQVVLNAPWYRRDVHHGLRFWAQVPGPQVDEPEALFDAIDWMLTDPPSAHALREGASHAAYPLLDGKAAARSAEIISERASRTWVHRSRYPSGNSPRG